VSAVTALDPQATALRNTAEVELMCAQCRGILQPSLRDLSQPSATVECNDCGYIMFAIDGIWRGLQPARANEIAPSLSAYEAVRAGEGRWSQTADFYRSLPWRDTTGRFADQWNIRARSFSCLLREILPECVKSVASGRLRVLDLGAGNCWMSYRLALLGHSPVAVDIGVGSKDGLGAAIHYQGVIDSIFPRFQAEMHWLPFSDGSFDVAIYNASIHYAQNYEAVLHEAIRVLRPSGAIVIIDSPTYINEIDGEAMKREKAAEFARTFGSDSGSMGGEQYLTPERLARLELLGIRWRRYAPWYGWRWAMRPIVARMKGRRRPSHFYIYLGTLASRGEES
jgi:SAM-dependent methyltransferase